MYKLRIAILLLIILTSTVVQSQAAQDRILARVNDDIITLSELEERLRPIIAKYESSYDGKELLQRLAKAEDYWLNQLVENKLILQEAVRKEITASRDEVDDRFEQIKTDFDSELQFNIFLESQGLNINSLKRSIEDNIKIGKATLHIREQARQKISPKEVLEYYESHTDDFREEPMARVLHILIRSKDNDGKAFEQIKNALQRINNGEDFSAIAHEVSDGPHAQQGGDLGFISQGQHIPEIDKAVFSLPIGEVSDIIKSNIGYHIIMVKQLKKERIKPFAQVQDEVENRILREKAKELWDEWIEGLKKKSFIEIYDKS